jgi:hypothetical protein
MIWVLVSLVLIVVVAQLWTVFHGRGAATADDAGHRAAVALYAIRRRLEVADFKREVRRDGADIRRQLRKELEQHDRRR